MNTGWRRIVSVVVAIVVAASPLLVCAPPASAVERHCAPSQTTETSHCQHSNAMDCCASPSPQAPSVPQDTQAQASGRSTLGGPFAQADAAVVPYGLPAGSTLSRIVRFAPPHGFRSLDLPTLNAVFLI
jgi:hypothetical protein